MNQPQNITFDVPNAFELEKLSELHKAMGDFTRTKILWQLMQGEQCVNDLAKTLSLTNSAISHQLHALRITKLVRSRKAGKRVFYSLQDEQYPMDTGRNLCSYFRTIKRSPVNYNGAAPNIFLQVFI